MPEKVRDCHDETGRAEAALEAMMLTEGLLDPTQAVDLPLTFDGFDLQAIDLDRKSQTRARASTVQKYGAGTAHSMFAADMRSGEGQFLTQEIAKKHPRFDGAGVGYPVDAHSNCFLNHWSPHFYRPL